MTHSSRMAAPLGAWLVAACCAACLGVPVAAAAPRSATTVTAPGAELRLSRAAYERVRGDAAGVIAQLESLDWTAPRFAGAGRAAWLLAEAYHSRGETPRLAALAAQVAAWPERDAFAALVPMLAASAPGAPDAGAAALARAAAQLAASDVAQAEATLAAIPESDRWSARARHTRALIALERGDAGRAAALLAALADDSTYGGRREARTALAGLALDRHDWAQALRHAEAAQADWNAQRAALPRVDDAQLWRAWLAAPDSAALQVLDGEAESAFARATALAAADLRDGVAPARPALLPARSRVAPAPAASPTPEEWRRVLDADAAASAASAMAMRARESAAAESLTLADLRAYLGVGRGRLARLDARLAPTARRLDSLDANLAALESRLRRVRDAAAQRVAARVAALVAQADALALWGAAMQRVYVTGPDSAHWQGAPAGAVSAARALEAERTLNERLRAGSARVGEAAPGWLGRSWAEAWRPALAERIAAQARQAASERAYAAALGRGLDSSLVAARGSRAWDVARAQVAAAERDAGAAHAEAARVRAQVARAARERTLAALDREREGLDYLQASAAWALAVQLSPADSARASAAVAANGSPDEAETGDPAQRRVALPLLRTFLERHPGSAARAEMRFRLADLELLEARREFRARMAAFLRAQESGGALPPVPVLEPGAALALYRRMLVEDAQFARLDAVRFNTAMILAEAGSPEAATHFRALLERWPDSPYAQESALRLGDLAFQERRWRDAVPLYARAAAGADPTLAVIARYKSGWAAYDEDRFEGAARAFAQVLDLYAGRRAELHVDVEHEASTYFVMSLAAAGGAPAWQRHFAAAGPRGYEHALLLELAQQLRRNGDLAGAAEADALLLARAPLHGDALLAAERRLATLQRAGDAAALERAQAELIERFGAGTAWAGAQDSDSLREAGAAFARTTSASLAHARHERARRTRTAADWRTALAADEAALARATTPAERARLQLAAARAQLELGEPDAALAACEAAAADAPDSVAAEALALAVVSADATYERARGGAARGPEAQANAVARAGDALLARFPAHPLRADVRWRQSQLALAHGDDARAYDALSRFVAADTADKRAPQAGAQRAEAALRLERFEQAERAFADAERLARAARRDDLARAAAAARQDVAFRAAEAQVRRDSTAFEKHARAYEAAAARWPAHGDAEAARYRAALAWERAGRANEAARVLAAFAAERPRSPLARDARLLLARQYETLGDSAAAGRAYLAYAALESDAPAAAAARLRAAQGFEAAGQLGRADSLRLDHVRRHPADEAGAMLVYERLAQRELDAVREGDEAAALARLLPPARAARAARSALAEYLRLARRHPELASRELAGRLGYLQGEAARVAAARVTLAAPLAPAVAARKAHLDSALVRYRRAMGAGSPTWAHAAAWRIGETLRDFGVALEASPAPAELAGDDLDEYRAVLADKARPFATRGMDAWVELARTDTKGAAPDAWVARARDAVAKHLAERFRFRPEAAFPAFDPTAANLEPQGVQR